MATTNQIAQFLIMAVSQRKKLIETKRSRSTSPEINQRTLNFLQVYAEEIKDRKRMAKFFVTHYERIKAIAPPTWDQQAHKIYNECQLIINS
jgi:hypothetical protein